MWKFLCIFISRFYSYICLKLSLEAWDGILKISGNSLALNSFFRTHWIVSFLLSLLTRSWDIENEDEKWKNQKKERRKKTEKQFAEQSGTWFFRLLFPTFTRKNFSYWLEFLIFRLSLLKTWALSNFIADIRKNTNLNWEAIEFLLKSSSSSFFWIICCVFSCISIEKTSLHCMYTKFDQ